MEPSLLVSGSARLPYLCIHCQNPEVVGIPYNGPPFLEEGEILNQIPIGQQQTYGTNGRCVLIRWRCVNCSTTWCTYMIWHSGNLDDRSPRYLFNFVNGAVASVSSLERDQGQSDWATAASSNEPVVSPELAGHVFGLDHRLGPISGSLEGPTNTVDHALGGSSAAANVSPYVLRSQSFDLEAPMRRTDDSPSQPHNQLQSAQTRSMDALSSATLHSRGPNFDPRGYNLSRNYGVCDEHRRNRKACKCSLDKRRGYRTAAQESPEQSRAAQSGVRRRLDEE